jgi:hypothetical protein
VSRRPARLFFALAAVAAAGVIVLAVAFALGPNARPGPGADEVALVRVEDLRLNEVTHLTVKELSGLDRLANSERERGHMTLWGPRSRPAGMPVFLVRADNGVRAFLGVDPRTGCELEDRIHGRAVVGDAFAFVDVCHGTGYDMSGRPTRGPGMWFLDELVLHIRSGIVYAAPHEVIAGGVARRY